MFIDPATVLRRRPARAGRSRALSAPGDEGDSRVLRHIETRVASSTIEHHAHCPLPETADELCAVARDVKAEVGDIRLGAGDGARGKALRASGYLAQFRLLHFATHRFLWAARWCPRAGPATDAARPRDGGRRRLPIGLRDSPLLSLTLIGSSYRPATPRLAQRQVGSAIGLARAFIYAQARSLLVSHGAV